MTDTLHDKAKDYIKSILDDKGLSLSGLAVMAGLSSTTLTRAFNDPNHRHEFSLATIDKIAKATGVMPAFFADEQNGAGFARRRRTKIRNRIAEIREQKELTQSDLATALDCHWVTVSKIERGEIKLNTDWMAKIADALDVPFQELLADDHAEEPTS